eukprot:CAMPEP_0182903298 /NCGR_PEP_ID=MMETSP0034_2-20130328/31168_1 /TAXON_ID=156128 /ORGANISM="Nephroselmis pyriformis, Strain CCMP717" /LENGTH=57 /DNA_ID=CAMNT_0025038139 /DNA_START=194 /DNA_END=367 /DNA_ORIENTATION=-
MAAAGRSNGRPTQTMYAPQLPPQQPTAAAAHGAKEDNGLSKPHGVWTLQETRPWSPT